MKSTALVLTVYLLATFVSALDAQIIQRAAGDQLMTSALIVQSAPGYLETLGARDPVEASIVFGSWLPPAAGDSIRYNDTLVGRWQIMKADSSGWFHHEWLSGAYVYVGVEAEQDETVLLEGMGHAMVYVNGSPRSGNPYGYKDNWESWEPQFNYSFIPVHLRKGLNTFLFQCNREILKVTIHHKESGVLFNHADITLPDLIAGKRDTAWGAIVVMNMSNVQLNGSRIVASAANGPACVTEVSRILPMSVRKVPFRIAGKASDQPGQEKITLELIRNSRTGDDVLDTTVLTLRVVNALDNRKETFISAIDGSVQYYAVKPALPLPDDPPPALFFSLHGAGVEALNQSASYSPKRWGHIVAPTGRRPYGYNWEDWGRSDAIEVLDIVMKKFGINKERVYLTGHSMGGHGVYHVASLFPDRFAAIGPSAGWVSFWSYRVRETIEHPTPIREMIQRATLPSDTYAMGRNFAQCGVYILHGSADDNVLVDQSRSMAEYLKKFHRDFVYHEEQGAGHWWDKSDEPGTDCVDWAPMFDFFARHARPQIAQTRELNFAVANPGVSSQNSWVGIEAQERQLQLSTIAIRVDPELRRFTGTSSNVERLSLDLSVLTPGAPFSAVLDSERIDSIPWPTDGARIWFNHKGEKWTVTGKPSPALKGPRRYGTLKDMIGNRVQFVYGTKGSGSENRWAFEKARFDAERFWYQGNGSIDVLPDSNFDPAAEPDRNVVLFGNSQTNGAWTALLSKSPVQVREGSVKVDDHLFKGNDLNCLFIRPRPGSTVASVGVIAGTGLIGMKLNTKMPYLLPGIEFPDCLVAKADVLLNGEHSILAAGFFGLDWSVPSGEFVWQEQ